MSNLTLVIDEEVLRKARIRALQTGTSVNAVVRDFLQTYAQADDDTDPINSFLQLARKSPAAGGVERSWSRADL